MKKRLFITPDYTTAEEIKKVRKELRLTQKEFAEFINCSKPTSKDRAAPCPVAITDREHIKQ